MKEIISLKEDVAINIQKFNKELKNFAKTQDLSEKILIDNIPNVRAWYVYIKNGKYYFGPSKYIGYQNIDAKSYCKQRKELDGRMTEKALSNWYEEISIKHPDFEELSSELSKFCSKYGKKPNSLFRINIPIIEQEKDLLEGDVVELIWKVFLGLNHKNKELLKSKVKKYKVR